MKGLFGLVLFFDLVGPVWFLLFCLWFSGASLVSVMFSLSFSVLKGLIVVFNEVFGVSCSANLTKHWILQTGGLGVVFLWNAAAEDRPKQQGSDKDCFSDVLNWCLWWGRFAGFHLTLCDFPLKNMFLLVRLLILLLLFLFVSFLILVCLFVCLLRFAGPCFAFLALLLTNGVLAGR